MIKLKEAKAFKSLTTVTYFLVEAFLTPQQSAFQADMVTVLKHLLESMGKKPQAEVIGVASDSRKNSMRELVTVDIDDDFRLNIARELKEKIEKKL